MSTDSRLFPAAFLDQLRERADLPAMVGRVVKLKRAGKRFSGCCPFHQEKTPSFTVDPVRNTFKCYGCPAHGDAFEWLMRQEHVPFHEAVAMIAKSVGLPLPKRTEPTQETAERARHLARLYRVLEQALRRYEDGLRVLTTSRAYFEARGITTETVARFRLGAVATGVVAQIRGHDKAEIVAAGIACESATPGEIYDRLRYRVIFPIYNHKGALVGFAGRALIAKPEKTPKYMNSPDTELFSKGRELYGLHLAKPAIRKDRTAIVVEGYFDVIRGHQEGDCRLVAPMGTSISTAQISRLYSDCDLIIFAFDGDKAGHRAALRAAAALLQVMRDRQQAKFVFLPAGEDPDSFIQAHGIADWRELINEAMPLSQFLCAYVAHRLDRQVPETQVAAADRAARVLAGIKTALLYRIALRLRFEELIGVPLQQD